MPGRQARIDEAARRIDPDAFEQWELMFLQARNAEHSEEEARKLADEHFGGAVLLARLQAGRRAS